MLHLLKLLARASPTNLPRPAVVYWLLTHYIVRPSQPHESTRPMDSVKSYIQSHRQAFEADLANLLRIPSVSADSRQRAETRRAAEWVVKQFEQIGLATRCVPDAELETETATLAATIVAGSWFSHREHKRALLRTDGVPLAAGLADEQYRVRKVGPDFAERAGSRFDDAERRPPAG